MIDVVDRLLEHDQWATATLLEVSRDLTGAQLNQPFDIGHRTLRATYKHMIFNVPSWTAPMTGQPVDTRCEDSSVAALIECRERFYPAFATLARRLRDEQRLDETFVDHYGAPQTFGGAILMVTSTTRSTAPRWRMSSSAWVWPTCPKSITGSGISSGEASSRQAIRA